MWGDTKLNLITTMSHIVDGWERTFREEESSKKRGVGVGVGRGICTYKFSSFLSPL